MRFSKQHFRLAKASRPSTLLADSSSTCRRFTSFGKRVPSMSQCLGCLPTNCLSHPSSDRSTTHRLCVSPSLHRSFSSNSDQIDQSEEEEEDSDYETVSESEEESCEVSAQRSIRELADEMHEEVRRRDGTWFEPQADDDFEYTPLPRMPGPSPFVERRYMNKVQYHSYSRLKLPLSSTHPLPSRLALSAFDSSANGTQNNNGSGTALRSNAANRPQMWVHNSNGDKLSMVTLPPDVFNVDVRLDIMFRCLRYEKLCKKGWDWKIVRNRGEVRGTGRKLRPQKGTGRARMSDGKAPPFRGGGKAHGKRPRDFSVKLNRKYWHLGFKHALSARYKEGDLILWDDLKLPRLRVPNAANGRTQAGVSKDAIDWTTVDKHSELQNLVPVDMLDWHENTRLYQDVERTRQMLRNWGWLKPSMNEKIHDRHTAKLFAEATESGNIVDLLEALPIANYGWEFLKEADQMQDATVPSILMVHGGEYLDEEFRENMQRVTGVTIDRVEDLMNPDATGMGVNRLLTFKKVVISLSALRQFVDNLSIEAEVARWNYWAEINTIEADDSLPEAFPEDVYGPQEIPDELLSSMKLY